MESKKVKIDSLIVIPELKEYYTKQSIENLVMSIQFDGGIKTPITVSKNLEIIDGYRRVDALIQLNQTEIPVNMVDVIPNTNEYVIRNMHRIKTIDDMTKDLKNVFEKFPKKMGQKNKDGIVYNRYEEIAKALNNKFKGKETITKLEYIINNDLKDSFLIKNILENNWKVENCFDFLNTYKNIDLEKGYGFINDLLNGKYSIIEVNKFIKERNTLETRFESPFIIKDKVKIFNEDCLDLANLIGSEPIIDLLATSIPYYSLRNYKSELKKQIGLEETKEQYAVGIGNIFKSIEPCLKDSCNVVINVGETYNNGLGLGIPFLIKDAIEKHTNLKYKDTIIWSKKNSRPQAENVKRLQNSIEYLLWFVKDNDKAYFKKLKFPVEGKEAKVSYGVKNVGKDGIVKKKSKSISKPYGKLVSHLKEQELENLISTSIGKDHELYNIISSGHPAPMSLSVLTTITLMLSPENALCCDPFGGSQISGKIFRLLNRKYISTESCKEYFNIGCQRLINTEKEFDQESIDYINQLVFGQEQQIIAA